MPRVPPGPPKPTPDADFSSILGPISFQFSLFFLLFVCFFVRAFLYSRASFFFILVCLFLRLLVCSFVCLLDYLLVVRWFRRSLWFACFLVVCLFVR